MRSRIYTELYLKNMSHFLITPLLFFFFVGLFVIPHPCRGSDYYVKPSMESVSSWWPTLKTLDEYANNTQELEGDVRMLFLAGVHNFTTDLTLSRLDTVQMLSMPGKNGNT